MRSPTLKHYRPFPWARRTLGLWYRLVPPAEFEVRTTAVLMTAFRPMHRP